MGGAISATSIHPVTPILATNLRSITIQIQMQTYEGRHLNNQSHLSGVSCVTHWEGAGGVRGWTTASIFYSPFLIGSTQILYFAKDNDDICTNLSNII